MYINPFMFATVVVVVSVSFTLIQWGVTKLLDGLYWNFYQKQASEKQNPPLIVNFSDDPFADEVDYNPFVEIGDEEEEAEYYVAEREEK